MCAILTQSRRNCQRSIWLLSGTGEGPRLAAQLSRAGWKVFVSVVSFQAALPYSDLQLEDVWVGALGGVEEICGLIKQSRQKYGGFDWVVDATHPFAVVISAHLQKACEDLDQRLLRLDRPIGSSPEASLIKDSAELAGQKLQGSRLLLALGSRHLNQAVMSARHAGALVFARILPSPMSIRSALASQIEPGHIAMLRPLQGDQPGVLESALCRRWSITAVVCRQSGGDSQNLWQVICKENALRLWLISRPKQQTSAVVVYSIDELFNEISIQL